MTLITFRCRFCTQTLRIAQDAAGTGVVCPTCNGEQRAPVPDEPAVDAIQLEWWDDPRDVSTGSLKLEDASGRIRARLFMDEHDTPNLIMYDDEGRKRLEVGLTSSGSGVVRLLDAEEEIRLRCELSGEGTPIVGLCDAAGTRRVQIQVSSNDTPDVILMDDDGKQRVALTVDAMRQPALLLSDEDQRLRAQMAVESGSGATFSMQTPDGTKQVALGGADQGGALVLHDPSGHPSLSLTGGSCPCVVLGKPQAPAMTLAVTEGARMISIEGTSIGTLVQQDGLFVILPGEGANAALHVRPEDRGPVLVGMDAAGDLAWMHPAPPQAESIPVVPPTIPPP